MFLHKLCRNLAISFLSLTYRHISFWIVRRYKIDASLYSKEKSIVDLLHSLIDLLVFYIDGLVILDYTAFESVLLLAIQSTAFKHYDNGSERYSPLSTRVDSLMIRGVIS